MRRLRHAAALALVGWYLMSPPPASTIYMVDGLRVVRETNTSERFDQTLPLSQWSTWYAYDAGRWCENGKAILWNAMGKYDAEARGFMLQCIATDDPRLKP